MGILPSSILFTGPAGPPLDPLAGVVTRISVYADDGQTLLYSYDPDATGTDPLYMSDGEQKSLYGFPNTGNTPFALQPVYISNSPSGTGRTIFDVLPGS